MPLLGRGGVVSYPWVSRWRPPRSSRPRPGLLLLSPVPPPNRFLALQAPLLIPSLLCVLSFVSLSLLFPPVPGYPDRTSLPGQCSSRSYPRGPSARVLRRKVLELVCYRDFLDLGKFASSDKDRRSMSQGEESGTSSTFLQKCFFAF
ncbi:hypothetical protein NDU88_001021 [Pleurodeles waltl]|uniref:Uncharacterized protein n=1 Tax=Pleurodeles waltl TaxID=8319 RepID=A0AAV7MLF0_PLEWA|nr:hypothetical protein NDU88_001021 [Pleurodeles waltl]